MMDIARKKNNQVDVPGLERELGVLVITVNPRKNKGIIQLNKALEDTAENSDRITERDFFNSNLLAPEAISRVQKIFPGLSNYMAMHYLINHETFSLENSMKEAIENIESATNFNPTKTKAEEILHRYGKIKTIMQQTVVEADPLQKALFPQKLDNILWHRTGGYIILLGVLYQLFQSIFLIAQYPMNAIEWLFAQLGGWLGQVLQDGWFSNLLITGIVAGLRGILVFVPQIMILFGLITLLAVTGYMARIRFL